MPVYVNRLLNLKKIKVVGFDMDYTLVRYNIEAFEGLTHNLAAVRLVDTYGYPKAAGKLEFDKSKNQQPVTYHDPCNFGESWRLPQWV